MTPSNHSPGTILIFTFPEDSYEVWKSLKSVELGHVFFFHIIFLYAYL